MADHQSMPTRRRRRADPEAGIIHNPETPPGPMPEASNRTLTGESFEVRDGDTLHVRYEGAKLQIVQYNTVQLDSFSYTRTLRAGDDVQEQMDTIYAMLREKSLNEARQKLAEFAEELRQARSKAGS